MRIALYAGTSPDYNYFIEVLDLLLAQNNFDHDFLFFYEKEHNFGQSGEKTICINKKNSINFNKLLFDKEIDVLWILTEYIVYDIFIPYIFTVWDLAFRDTPFFPEVNVANYGKKWLGREEKAKKYLPRASYIVAGTNVGKSQIQFFYRIPDDRIKVIPFPSLKSDCVSDSPKHNLKDILPNDYFFYPASFHPHKNHILIVEALNILKTKFNKKIYCVFTRCGGFQFEYIKSKIKKYNIESQFVFLNSLTVNEMKYLYKNAKALIFPTLIGPDNLPPVEAISLGCPVILSNLSGHKEQLGDAALYFDPLDENDLANCINSLYNSAKLREQLIEKGFQRTTELSLENYIFKMIEILNDFSKIRRTWHSSKEFVFCKKRTLIDILKIPFRVIRKIKTGLTRKLSI